MRSTAGILVIVALVSASCSTGDERSDAQASTTTSTESATSDTTSTPTTRRSTSTAPTPSTSTATIVATTTVAPETLPRSDDPSQGGVDGPVIYIAPADMAEGALMTGVLGLEDGCLFVGEGVGRATVAWPFGTRWQADPPAVIGPTGFAVEVGQSPAAGDGYHENLAFFATDPEATRHVAMHGH